MLQYVGLQKDYSIFSAQVSKIYEDTNDNHRCAVDIKEGFTYISSIVNDKVVYDQMSDLLDTCQPINNSSDMNNVLNTLKNAYI